MEAGGLDVGDGHALVEGEHHGAAEGDERADELGDARRGGEAERLGARGDREEEGEHGRHVGEGRHEGRRRVPQRDEDHVLPQRSPEKPSPLARINQETEEQNSYELLAW